MKAPALLVSVVCVFAASVAFAGEELDGTSPRLLVQAHGDVSGPVIDPSGRLLATTGSKLSLFALPMRALVDQLPGDGLFRAEFVSGGRWLLLQRIDRFELYDPRARAVAHTFSTDSDERDHRLVTLEVARSAEVAAGIVSTPEGARLRVFPLDGAAPAREWPIAEGCYNLGLSSSGAFAVAACRDHYAYVDARRGQLRKLPRAHASADPERLWISDDGATLAESASGDGQPQLHWVSLRNGKARQARLPGEARIASVLGLFGGARPYAIVRTSDGTLVELAPNGQELRRVSLGDSVSAVSFDEAHQSYVVSTHANELQLHSRGGVQVGAITRPHARVDWVNYEPAEDRVFLQLSSGGPGFRRLELDLREGTTRPLALDGPAPVSLMRMVEDIPELIVVDERDTDRRFTIEGIANPKAALPLVRIDARYTLVGEKTRIGILDLRARRIAHWVSRGPTPAVTAAHFDPASGQLVLGDETGAIESWDVTRDRRIATGRLDLGESPPDQRKVTAIGRLASGELLVGAQPRLFVSSTGASLHTAPAPEVPPMPVSDLVVSPDGKRFVVQNHGDARLCHFEESKPKRVACTRLIGSDPVFLREGRDLVVETDTGLALLDGASGALRLEVAFTPAGAPLFVTPTSHYLAAPGALSLGALVRGVEARHLEEADVELHSPSKILEFLGRAPPERLERWRAFEARRRERSGANARTAQESASRPSVRLKDPAPLWTDSGTLELQAEVEATALPVRMHVRINGTPLGGRAGLPAKGRGTSFVEAIQLPLSAGENRVTLTAVDANGREAFGESFVVTSTAATSEVARVFFLGVGVSSYADASRSLQYAAKDVRDVARALRDLAGPRTEVKLLVDAEATSKNIREARAFLERATFRDLVVVYFAGHGLLDGDGSYFFASHDLDFAQPAKRGVSFADLENLVDGLGAGSKVLFIDSCHAGAQSTKSWVQLASANGARGATVLARGVDEDEEEKEAEASAGASSSSSDEDAELQTVFADLRRGTGATVIAAAGQAEYALESPGTRNGLFTHAVLKSLLEGRGVRGAGELWIDDLVFNVRDLVRDLSGGRQTPQVREANASFKHPLLRSPGARPVFTPKHARAVDDSAISSDATRLAMVRGTTVTVLALPSGATVFEATLPNESSCATSVCKVLPVGRPDQFVVMASRRYFWLDARQRSIRQLPGEHLSNPVVSADGRWVGSCDGLTFAVLDTTAPRPAFKPASAEKCFEGFSTAKGRFVTTQLNELLYLDPASGAIERTSLASQLPAWAWGLHRVSGDGRVFSAEYGQANPPGARVVAWDDAAAALTIAEVKGELQAYVMQTRSGAVLQSSGRGVVSGMLPQPMLLLSSDGAPLQEWKVTPDSVALRSGQIIVPARSDMKVGDTVYQQLGESAYFRVFDLEDGRPAGWFALPDANVKLLPGADDAVWVVAKSSGQVSRIDVPRRPRER